MRGKAKELPPRQCYLGITPAHAGKSAFLVGVVGDFEDHPRACGEKKSFADEIEMELGSPPRMRGKVAFK